MKGIFYT